MKKKYFNDKMQNIRNDGSFFFIIDLGYTRVNLPIYIYTTIGYTWHILFLRNKKEV